MTLRALRDLATPAPTFGERDALAAAVPELSAGRPALLRLGEELRLISPSDAVGHSLNRRLVDLPSVPVRALPSQTPLLQALAESADAEHVVAMGSDGVAGIAARTAIIEVLLGTLVGSGADPVLVTASMYEVLERSPEGVVVLDESRRVGAANGAGRRMLAELATGGEGEPVIGLGGIPIETLIEDERQGTSRDVAVSEPSRRVFTVRTLASSATPSGKLVLLLRDVTNLRHRQAREAEQERMAILGQLATGIVHDLNNMLTIVMGEASLLRLETSEGDSRARAAIEGAASRAAGLVRQLLAFARCELTDPVPLDLRQVLRDAREILERLLGERGSLRLSLPDHLDPVLADPVQIERILANLVDNAGHATPAGGFVRISLANEPDCRLLGGSAGEGSRAAVRLSVEDDGAGMDAETAKRVFEPHFTTRGSKGMGLGLATVRASMTQLGGQVRLTTSPGHGARFDLFFPVHTGVNPARSIAGSAASPRGRLSGRLLVLEEQPDVLDFILRALRHGGYRADPATTPAAAWELTEIHGEPDLFLCDTLVRDSAGVEVARSLRERFPRLHVLLMSSIADEELLSEADHPLVEYLAKPFTVDQLLSRVAAIIGDAID